MAMAVTSAVMIGGTYSYSVIHQQDEQIVEIGKPKKAELVKKGRIVFNPAYKTIVPRTELLELYLTPDGRYAVDKSEVRKRAIMKEIKNIRVQIRQKAESLQIDKNTTIVGYTANQKVIIHSTKLLLDIIKIKSQKSWKLEQSSVPCS